MTIFLAAPGGGGYLEVTPSEDWGETKIEFEGPTMMKSRFLRSMVSTLVPAASLLCFATALAFSQSAHLQTVVFDGSTRAGWYSFPGQRPKLKFSGDKVSITSRMHSTVFLSRAAQDGATLAEVSLDKAPASTSSISGLAVMSDPNHAMVIGLESGHVILWQLDPVAARIVARQKVNGNASLQFRVTGGNGTPARFFWRHKGDASWHALGSNHSDAVVASWREPVRYGLLLDGPRGSEVTFSNFRSSASDMANAGTMTAALVSGE